MRADTRRALTQRVSRLSWFGGEGEERLTADQSLLPGQFIKSQHDDYRFILQSDGNAVIYRKDVNLAFPDFSYHPSTSTWASGTNGRNVARATMQGDGNLVLYDHDNHPVWATGTNGHKSVYVIIQNDGNLVLYEPGGSNPLGHPIWASRDHGSGGGPFSAVGSFVNTAVSAAGKVVGAAIQTVAGGLHDIQNAIANIPYVGGIFATLYDLATAPFTYVVYIADAVSHGEKLDQAILDKLNDLKKESLDVAPWVATVISCFPGFGPIVSAAIMTAVALAEGVPLTEVAITAALSLIPGMAVFAHYMAPIIQFGIDLATAIANHNLSLKTVVVDGLKALFRVIGFTIPDFIYTAVGMGVDFMQSLAKGVKPEIAALKEAIDFLKQYGAQLLGDAFKALHLDDILKIIGDKAASAADQLTSHLALAKALSDIKFPSLPGPLNDLLRKVLGTCVSTGAAKSLQAGIKPKIDNLGATLEKTGAKLITDQATKALGGVAASAENKVLSEAQKTQPANAQKGFNTGVAVMQTRVNTFQLVSVRNGLDPDNQKGFDAACALHIGRVAVPPPKHKKGENPTQIARRRVGFAMAHGVLAMPPANREPLVSALTTHPEVQAGAMNATAQIANANLSTELRFYEGVTGSGGELAKKAALRAGLLGAGLFTLGLRGAGLVTSTLTGASGLELVLLSYGLWKQKDLASHA